MQENKERIIIFIDGSNHYHIVKRLLPNKKAIDFNFEKFIEYLAQNKKVVRTYYYTAPLDWKKDE